MISRRKMACRRPPGVCKASTNSSTKLSVDASTPPASVSDGREAGIGGDIATSTDLEITSAITGASMSGDGFPGGAAARVSDERTRRSLLASLYSGRRTGRRSCCCCWRRASWLAFRFSAARRKNASRSSLMGSPVGNETSKSVVFRDQRLVIEGVFLVDANANDFRISVSALTFCSL